MLIHTLIIPGVYVYLGAVLAIATHLGRLVEIQQRAKQHIVPFFFFLVGFPFVVVYVR